MTEDLEGEKFIALFLYTAHNFGTLKPCFLGVHILYH